MVRISQALLAFTIVASSPGCAELREPTSICIEEIVPLDRHTRPAFERELLALLKDRNVILGCPARGAIRLKITNSPPEHLGHALGIAWKTTDRILPYLEVYVLPVMRRLGHLRASGVVGRTLARVAAHEVVHYLDQRHDHDDAGILQTSFTIGELAGYDRESLTLQEQKP